MATHLGHLQAQTKSTSYEETHQVSRDDVDILHAQTAIDGDFYVPQKPLTRFFLFEKNIKIYTYDYTPVKINFSLLLYILIAIGFTILPAFTTEGEDLTSWIGFAIVVLLFQLLSAFTSVTLHFYSLTSFIASQHCINLWAFGHIGYGYDYNKKKMQIASEILIPASVFLVFGGLLFAITIIASTLETNLFPVLPMSAHLGTNVVNELWKNQAALFVLHVIVPTYPFGLARVLATSLYPGKTLKEISQILLFPSILFGIVFTCVGIYLYSAYLLFPGIWCLYQCILWVSAIKKKAINCLPLYQLIDENDPKNKQRKKDSDVIDMPEHEFQAYRKGIVKQEERDRQASLLKTQPKHTSLEFDTGVNHFDLGSHKNSQSADLDTHSMNPMFSQSQQNNQKRMKADYDPIGDQSPRVQQQMQQNNTGVPMIQKRKKRKKRDANGNFMFDNNGNHLYEYKYFDVPDPNYNPNQSNPQNYHNQNQQNNRGQNNVPNAMHQQIQNNAKPHKSPPPGIKQQMQEHNEESSESYDVEYDDEDEADEEPEPEQQIMAPPSREQRQQMYNSPPKEEDIMSVGSLPEDMPAPPPSNLRQLHMNASTEDWEKRGSVQFGFRSSQTKKKASINIPEISPKDKRGSLAIRVRSNSGKEKQLVNYIAPVVKGQDSYQSQDNVNPLAFALQKKEERKRKKKKKQNTLSTVWNSKQEKKIKKKLRKQRMAQQKQQKEISLGLGAVAEDSGESSQDAFKNSPTNAMPGPPTEPPPPNAKDIPGPPQIDMPGPPVTGKAKKKNKKMGQIRFAGMQDSPVEEEESINDAFVGIQQMNREESGDEDDDKIKDAFLQIEKDFVHTDRQPTPPAEYMEEEEYGNMYQQTAQQTQQQNGLGLDLEASDDEIADAFLATDRSFVRTGREPTVPKGYVENRNEEPISDAFGISIPSSVFAPNEQQKQRIAQQKRLRKDKQEKERLERERIERERIEQERLEREKERIRRERIEQERLEKERIERERGRVEQERVEQERIERERLEKERAQKEQMNRNVNTNPNQNMQNGNGNQNRGNYNNQNQNRRNPNNQNMGPNNNNQKQRGAYNQNSHQNRRQNNNNNQRGSYMGANNNQNRGPPNRGNHKKMNPNYNNRGHGPPNNQQNNGANNQRRSHMGGPNQNQNNHINRGQNPNNQRSYMGGPNQNRPPNPNPNRNQNNNNQRRSYMGPNQNQNQNQNRNNNQRGSYMRNLPNSNNQRPPKQQNSGANPKQSKQNKPDPQFFKKIGGSNKEDDDDSVVGFKPPAPAFAVKPKKKLPPNPQPQPQSQEENNGYGMMMAPPSRTKRKEYAQKQKQKPKSVWDINENEDDEDADDGDWKKNNVLGMYDKRKSCINEMVSDESMRRIDIVSKRKSVFDESSSESDSEVDVTQGKRLTVDVTNARNFSVSGNMGRL